MLKQHLWLQTNNLTQKTLYPFTELLCLIDFLKNKKCATDGKMLVRYRNTHIGKAMGKVRYLAVSFSLVVIVRPEEVVINEGHHRGGAGCCRRPWLEESQCGCLSLSTKTCKNNKILKYCGRYLRVCRPTYQQRFQKPSMYVCVGGCMLDVLFCNFKRNKNQIVSSCTSLFTLGNPYMCCSNCYDKCSFWHMNPANTLYVRQMCGFGGSWHFESSLCLQSVLY